MSASGRLPEDLAEGHRPVRVVTAASLFDGHDAAINIMRRLLQSRGAEVIHLGHDRSVDEIVEAVVEESADAVAISSYQGGHMEFFRYLLQRLAQAGLPQVRVYGGGGGTIRPFEIEALQQAGVARIFSPEDGRVMGLDGMIGSIVEECLEARRVSETDPSARLIGLASRLTECGALEVAALLSFFENHGETRKQEAAALRAAIQATATRLAPIVGFTGTGGAGKSSVVDELVRRLRRDAPGIRIALLLVDPTRRRSGGALLGDRIRMNAIGGSSVFVRSMATRRADLSLGVAVGDGLMVLRSAGFDVVFLETAGIGQSDSAIVDQVDCSLYVMTPEYGAPSQLEKIDMIDFADLIVLNKCDRRGAADALRDVRKQWRRNRNMPVIPDEAVPVFPTVARNWDDPGTETLARALEARLGQLGLEAFASFESETEAKRRIELPEAVSLVPNARQRYLAEIAEALRDYHARVEDCAEQAALADGYARVIETLSSGPEQPLATLVMSSDATGPDQALWQALCAGYTTATEKVDADLAEQLAEWPAVRARYAAARQTYHVRNRATEVRNRVETLAGTALPKVALPKTKDWGDLVRYLALENLPGRFPYTAGVFAFKSQAEDPTRMFAGEGGPERTNRRFHLLSSGQPSARLSTAFDSVTLYGRDPANPPDIFGKVGNSGVSICNLDDAKKLYSGFDLSAASTSVSLTINGPAPIVLA
ncbi:MAG: methylmalonyl-CoA mutase family protein, partial [Myxococcota bacterium]